MGPEGGGGAGGGGRAGRGGGAGGRSGGSGTECGIEGGHDVLDGAHRAVPPPDHVGDHAGPPGLVGRAETGRVVPVKVLVEQQVIFPLRILLQPLDPAEAGPPPVRADEENRDEPVLQVGGDGVEGELLPGPGRVLQRQVVAEEPVVPPQHVDQQEVEREPQRAAPVGVAAEHRRGGLGRLVVDRGHLAFHVQHVRMVAMVGRQGPQPVRGQELALVEQGRRELFQLAEADQAEQQPLVAGFAAHHALLGERGRVVDALPAQEVRELLAQPQRVVEHPLVDGRRGQHRDDADHGPDLHRDGGAVRGEQLVVEEAVAFVPHVLVVDRVGDAREMLKELERDVAGRGAGRTGTARSRCVAMLIA